MFPRAEALWAPIPPDGLPVELVDAFERTDWPRLRELMGMATRSAYGRQILQLRKRVPHGVDPVLSQHRGWAALSDGDWDDLERCLRGELVDVAELAGLRDLILAPIDPHAEPGPRSETDIYLVGSWACDLNGMIGDYRRLMRRMLGWRSDRLALERGVPPAPHVQHRLIQGRFLLALLESLGGRLDVAEALAAETIALGAAENVHGILAADLRGGIVAARGGSATWPLGYPDHLRGPRGQSPIDAVVMFLHLAPLLALRSDEALPSAAELAEAIAIRFASPRLVLQARTWRVAAVVDAADARARAAALLVTARRTGAGLRFLPLLLHAIAERRVESFAEAEREARRAGALWAQVSASSWSLALDPDPIVGRRLARLLRISGWRRPALVPSEVAADAALGMTSTGIRGSAVIELALASGRRNVTYEVARRHLDDPMTDGDTQRAAITALATLGTTHARELLHRLARRPDALGRAAAVHLTGTHPTSLTEREVEVLDHAGHGLTNKEIADRLSLSPHTVARHLANARAKLGAANRAEAVAKLGER